MYRRARVCRSITQGEAALQEHLVIVALIQEKQSSEACTLRHAILIHYHITWVTGTTGGKKRHSK